MELFRSLIFVPGNRSNMLERAITFDADIIMVDLEDSVPPGEKITARGVAEEWVSKLAKEGPRPKEAPKEGPRAPKKAPRKAPKKEISRKWQTMKKKH